MFSSVSGGYRNFVDGQKASISGGYYNSASGTNSSVSGGGSNQANGDYSSVTGGVGKTASGIYSYESGTPPLPTVLRDFILYLAVDTTSNVISLSGADFQIQDGSLIQ
mgnify:CR=1 FL=1